MIEKFFTTTLTNTRMVWTGNTSALTAVGSFVGHIQQASAEYAEQLRAAFGVTHTIWCAMGTNVRTGDTITVATGSYAGTYSVRNIQTNATGTNEHLELIVIKDV